MKKILKGLLLYQLVISLIWEITVDFIPHVQIMQLKHIDRYGPIKGTNDVSKNTSATYGVAVE